MGLLFYESEPPVTAEQFLERHFFDFVYKDRESLMTMLRPYESRPINQLDSGETDFSAAIRRIVADVRSQLLAEFQP